MSDARARPVDVCRALLGALDATEGRRRRRKRNTSADAIGIGMKRSLLESALRDEPAPDEFEGWLLERCFERGAGEGAWRAMALEIFQEWRLAEAAPSFRAWLDAGSPSDDKPGGRLPVLALLVGVVLAGAGCGPEIEADVEDVPSIAVEEMSERDRQQAGALDRVLQPMLARERAGDVVYDAPVSLARPPDARVWPPPTGTHGDEAAGATAPDSLVGGSSRGSPAVGADAAQGPPVAPDTGAGPASSDTASSGGADEP